MIEWLSKATITLQDYAMRWRRQMARVLAQRDRFSRVSRLDLPLHRLLNPNSGVIDITLEPEDKGRASVVYR